MAYAARRGWNFDLNKHNNMVFLFLWFICCRCIGDMYFKVDKLKNWSPQPQTLAGFERIRTVGKGEQPNFEDLKVISPTF